VLGINTVDHAFLISTEEEELCSDVMASSITDDPDYWQKRAEDWFQPRKRRTNG